MGATLEPGLAEVERLLSVGDWAGARARLTGLVTSLPLPPLHAVMLRCRSVTLQVRSDNIEHFLKL